jgi:Na+-transporting NADH:ubiquinone oxidoreductase subunit NqrB
MFKIDKLVYGIVLGLLCPLIGLVALKFKKFGMLTFEEVFQFVYVQPGHQILTFYANNKRDNTVKGLFISSLVYGLVILGIKFLS